MNWTNHPAHQYAVDVTLGKTTAPKYVVKACDRYLRDLDAVDDTGLEFRPKTAAASVATATSETSLAACHHPKTHRTAMARGTFANRLAILVGNFSAQF